jgi:Ni/Fe-hydrogenase subunit HybB-like protein
MENYRVFARPAILTAFLGYAAVAVGLMYDLGLPWNIWHPIAYPQYHSVLFEVALCVMLYLTVLFLEFAPVVLEHSWFDRPLFRKAHKLLKKITIPLVIAGIMLSSLHQSSLGSLFLITPYRLHPLWYSPIIWVLFLISAVALGLMMVTAESYFSSWFFGHKLPQEKLANLGRAASVVLFGYAGLRLTDLAVRGILNSVFDGSWQSHVFLFELLVSALVPAVLLQFRRVRQSPKGLALCAGMTVLGMIGYRFDVCIVAFARPEGMSYFPSWMEIAVSVGIVAFALLVFIFFVEKFQVLSEEEKEGVDEKTNEAKRKGFAPESTRMLLPGVLHAPRRYSLAAIMGAAGALAFLSSDVIFGEQVERTPVSAAHRLDAWALESAHGAGHEYVLEQPQGQQKTSAQKLILTMIDGNRDGRMVPFDHAGHVARMESPSSCEDCHHLNMPYQKNSSCHQCHRDMYLTTDIFNHASHVAKLHGNQSCQRCHLDPEAPKNRDTARACEDCHGGMLVKSSMQQKGPMTGLATAYMDAMHGLCMDCHRQKVKAAPEEHRALSTDCTHCHRDINKTHLDRIGPYGLEEQR